MADTKHTPGPWRVEGMLTHRVKPGHIISHGLNEYRDGPAGYVCDTLGTTFWDARLIAAAPELLEALRGLVAYVDENVAQADVGPHIDRALDAISKATGGAL